MKKIELLSPAGNIECLKAAVYAGCDAVYVGGKNFGARSYAGNFTLEELEAAVNFCHLYDVKIYVTVNTIIYEEEVKAFMKYIDNLVNINVDALIMQDIGMIDLVRQTYPNFEIHASTQMHIHNEEGVLFAKNLGVNRVVLARETPIEKVKEIKEKTNMDIEIFGHGALCVSYSGQCFMSYLIGGRSGNRGTCAQCCRQKYSLEIDSNVVIKDKYILSMKDLCTLENLDKFIEAGIDSIKIEGRMKRKEYVYLVTSIYRKAIDSYYDEGKINITKKDLLELYKIFNRKFTKGFLFNEKNDNITNEYRPNHMGIEIGKVIKVNNGMIKCKIDGELNINDGIRILDNNDIGFIVTNIYKKNKLIKTIQSDTIEIKTKFKPKEGSIIVKTTDYKQLKEIDKKLESNSRKVLINIKISVKKDKNIELELINNNIKINVNGEIPFKAINKPITKNDIEKQINRLGNTIYKIDKLEIELDDDLFIPLSELNNLRRKALELLENKKLEKKVYKKNEYKRNPIDYKKENEKNIYVKDYNIKKDNIYNIVYKDKKDEESIMALPRIVDKYVWEDDKYLIRDVGGIYKYKKGITDFSVHATNSYTIAYLHTQGIEKITLSYELNDKQIEKIIKKYKNRYNVNPNLELIVYGYVEAMITKYNPLEKYKEKEGYLIDRFGNKYYIKNEKYGTIIYNYKKMNRENKEKYFEMGVNSIRFNILNKRDYENILN